MTTTITRRQAMDLMAMSLLAKPQSSRAAAGWMPAVLASHDQALQQLMDRQVTDPHSRWCGAIADRQGLYHCGSAAGLLSNAAAALFHERSRFHQSQMLRDRMKLAAGFLDRSQNADGNIDLIVTNFNSPPDTGFVVHRVATAAKLAQSHGHPDILSLMEGFLHRAGRALAQGGIHTPNHRWVVCAALAQIHDLFPDPRYVRRIDQWLAEGIDIDSEGQFTERSTAVYNAVTDNALVVVADKLKRLELLEPVRKNLDAMAFLLHSDGEVVTEISRRQDQNTRETMARYWFALRYLALRDRNGLYASMLGYLEPKQLRLAALMEYPQLQKELPPCTPLPDTYERHYPLSNITRIRRGKTSITILCRHNSRWLSIHHGHAVIRAVRFASAFFGKGQFVPTVYEKRQDRFYFRQELQGQYYQPLTDSSLLPVGRNNWSLRIGDRKRTEICRLIYEATIVETADGLDLTISAHGTDNVPLAVEINLREGGKLSGVVPAADVNEAFLLQEGFAQYQKGPDTVRLGPGKCQHRYLQIRGAHAKLPGPSVYLTGYTPFRHRLKIRFGLSG